jgi:hypothetical protein
MKLPNMKYMNKDKFHHWLTIIFPEQEIYNRRWSLRQRIAIFMILGVIFFGVSNFVPANGFIAFDWVYVFSRGRFPAFYPPWGELVTRWLNWQLFFSLSLASIGLSILMRSKHMISSIAAILALPVFWTMFLGQLEGLVTLGLLGLPWLVPLVLLKPQISVFALGAKRSYLVAGVVWLAISFGFWGFWPAKMFAINTYYAEGRYVQDISIGLVGVFVALPMFWFSRGDMDMLMLSGSFITPHLIPYNMLPFTSAIARLKPIPALIACLLSWLPFSANWLGNQGWWLGWLFVIWLWSWLAALRYFGNNCVRNQA